MFSIAIQRSLTRMAATVAIAGAVLASMAALADPLSLAPRFHYPHDVIKQERSNSVTSGSQREPEISSRLRRRLVDYRTDEAAGTIVVDTPNTYLYLVLAGGKAIRYGIGVGREGFTWSGVRTVERKAVWPDWVPPADMLRRQPYLPRFMAGGPSNPLGARALYLGGTVYRIHGTNDPSTIGKRVSSGCFRMLNDDVIDLYARVSVGAQVVVLPAHSAQALKRQSRSNASRARVMTADIGRARGPH